MMVVPFLGRWWGTLQSVARDLFVIVITEAATENLTLQVIGLSDLPDSHPLKEQGLLTPGYLLSGVISAPGVTAPVIVAGFDSTKFSVITAEILLLQIIPTDIVLTTEPLSRNQYHLRIEFSTADGLTKFVVHQGQIFVYRKLGS